MKDFYKKLMKMSVKDAQEIAREDEVEAVEEMAMPVPFRVDKGTERARCGRRQEQAV